MMGNHIQWSITYPNPTYPDYSLIRSYVWEPILIIYRESDSFMRIFSYLDSQLWNGGVWTSEGPLYWYLQYDIAAGRGIYSCNYNFCSNYYDLICDERDTKPNIKWNYIVYCCLSIYESWFNIKTTKLQHEGWSISLTLALKPQVPKIWI